MNELIKLAGDYLVDGVSISTICYSVAAIVFLVKLYRKVVDYLVESYNTREARDKMLTKTFEEVQKYQELRSQDQERLAEIKLGLTNSIDSLKTSNNEIREQLNSLVTRTQKYELAVTRDKLLQSYRYYINPAKNPKGAWTELEKEAFFELFKGYEDAGGDGFMHTTVQPEMNRLSVVPMTHSQEVAELMHSRC